MTKATLSFGDQEKIPREELVAATGDLVYAKLCKAPSAVAEIAEHLSGSVGKGIRTVVLGACACDHQGMVPEASAKAAAAVELLHMATLVHDDIIDDAPTRRGIPSVQSRFGKKQAVLGGDWLLCCAMNAAVSIQLPGEDTNEKLQMLPSFSRTVERVCLGELSQSSQNGNLDLTAPRYLKIISQKTAALFYLAAYAGAVLGKCDPKETRLLLRFAVYLGLVFQIVDDLKDYTLEETDTLKPVKNDLVSGVITLPLILAFAKEPALKPFALDIIKTGQGVNQLIDKVQKAGGIQDTWAVARRYGEKALALLEQLENPHKQKVLSGLMDRALQAAKAF